MALASGRPVRFVATAEAGDEEMAQRIARHRRHRPPGWETVEEPTELAEVVRSAAADTFVLVDCLTLWVSNLLAEPDDAILDRADLLAAALADRPGPAVVVSNEVGWGIVPENAVARRYRDLLGGVNTVMAGSARATHLMVAGRALVLGEAPT
jgi:adenosylcobinamide kinase/adenosylcobinamide-phosphate guanylyltransferase